MNGDGLPDFAELAGRAGAPPFSSWGLFGPADEVGTINLIDPDTVAAAARLVTRGAVFPLNWDVDLPGPALYGRSSPVHQLFHYELGKDECYDRFFPQASSQWDALAHQSHPRWGYYNGFKDADLPGEGESLGIHRWAERGIASRFVLIDLAADRAARGEPLDCSQQTVFTVADLEQVIARQGVEIRRGDVLLLRFGWVEWYEGTTPEQREELAAGGFFPTPGLDTSHDLAAWLWNNRVAAVAADNPALESTPLEISDETFLHFRLIPLLGMAVGEMFRLGDLAADCAETGCYEGLFVAAPMNKRGGVGSPANAVALL